ncbi:hypothetical protein ACOL3J_11440, partial [Aliarcobacter butzleri]
FSKTLCFIAFYFASSISFGFISTAIIFIFSNNIASITDIIPLSVPISKTFIGSYLSFKISTA